MARILTRGRAVAARQAHNLEVVGSNPTPATTTDYIYISNNKLKTVPSIIKGAKGILRFFILFFLYPKIRPYISAEKIVIYNQTIILVLPIKNPLIKAILISPPPNAFSFVGYV